MKEHQNHNLTGSRQKFGKVQSMSRKKLKVWDDEIKLTTQQQKFSIQEVSSKTIDYGTETQHR
jgi:hypothetical protein